MAREKISELHFIEDSDDEVFLARMLLETENVDIELRHYTGLEAFFTVSKEQDEDAPMLILVDMNMPNLKGDAVIRKIVADPFYRKAMIGMCSGSEDPADRRLALGAGAQFFVRKPLDLRCLNDICSNIPQLFCEQTGDVVALQFESDILTQELSHSA